MMNASFRALVVVAALLLVFLVNCGDDDDDDNDAGGSATPTPIAAPTPTPGGSVAACAPADCGNSDRVGSQTGCFCDEICFGLGDCCDNVCEVCGPFPNC